MRQILANDVFKILNYVVVSFVLSDFPHPTCQSHCPSPSQSNASRTRLSTSNAYVEWVMRQLS